MTIRELREVVNNVKDEYLDNQVYFWLCDGDANIRYDYPLFEVRPIIGGQLAFDINLFENEEYRETCDITGLEWDYSEDEE